MRNRVRTRPRLSGWCLFVAGCGGRDATVVNLPQITDGQRAAPHGEPEIAISLPDANGTFHFSFCGGGLWSSAVPQIRDIFISRRGLLVGPGFWASAECIWEQAGGAPLTTEWQYGSAPAGSKTIGGCAPPATDRAHEITVSGVGLGSNVFSVNEQGVWTAAGDGCTKHSSDEGPPK
jgi:hypothetical protein